MQANWWWSTKTERKKSGMTLHPLSLTLLEHNSLHVITTNCGYRHCLVTEEEEKKSSTLANYLRDMGEDLWCVIQIVWDKKTGQTALVPRHKDEVCPI